VGGVAGAQPIVAAPYADVRPAWAHSYGCESRRELTTASEVECNCTRVTKCGEEALGVNHEPMYKNGIQGTVEQGKRA
jgi:hypothetical protein